MVLGIEFTQFFLQVYINERKTKKQKESGPNGPNLDDNWVSFEHQAYE